MATLQKKKFLSNDAHTAVLNLQGSKSFVKKLIPAAVAFIIHQRTDLNRSDFDTRSRNGLIYKVLKPNVQEPYLKDVSKWFTGILDAFERNYLRELFLIISTMEEQPHVLERYKFSLEYMGNDVIPFHSPASQKEVSEAMDNLLKGIASLDHYKKFKKDEFALGMYMNYYDDVTPTDYDPPFFGDDSETAIVEKLLDDTPTYSNNYFYLGNINTGFHVIKCRAKGNFSMDNTESTTTDLDEEIINSVETCSLNAVKENIQMEVGDDSISIPGINKSLHPTSPASSSDIECISINTTINSSSNGVTSNDGCTISCMCQISSEFAYIHTVRCTECSLLQHATCAVEPVKDGAYVCQICKYDDILTPSEARQRELVSVFRLTVAVAHFTKKLPEDILEKLPEANKVMLLTKLQRIGALSIQDGKLHFHLNVLEKKYDEMEWYQ